MTFYVIIIGEGDINYESNRGELDKVVPYLEQNEYIRHDSIHFWYKDFWESQV